MSEAVTFAGGVLQPVKPLIGKQWMLGVIENHQARPLEREEIDSLIAEFGRLRREAEAIWKAAEPLVNVMAITVMQKQGQVPDNIVGAIDAAVFNVMRTLIRLEARAMSAPGGSAEDVARRFHEIYERLAPSFGYETRPETREFDPTSKNGRLMIATIEQLLQPEGVLMSSELVERLYADALCAELDSTPDIRDDLRLAAAEIKRMEKALRAADKYLAEHIERHWPQGKPGGPHRTHEIVRTALARKEADRGTQ